MPKCFQAGADEFLRVQSSRGSSTSSLQARPAGASEMSSAVHTWTWGSCLQCNHHHRRHWPFLLPAASSYRLQVHVCTSNHECSDKHIMHYSAQCGGGWQGVDIYTCGLELLCVCRIILLAVAVGIQKNSLWLDNWRSLSYGSCKNRTDASMQEDRICVTMGLDKCACVLCAIERMRIEETARLPGAWKPGRWTFISHL